MVEERIRIIFEERGSRVVQRSLGAIGGRASASAGSVDFLRNALLGLASVATIRQLARTADSFTVLQNRIGVVTESTQDLNRVTDSLLKISNETRSSLSANAELFTRLSLAAGELGFSEKELLDTVKALNQAVFLSGATAAEAENGIIQLSQGIASGALQGDELRSVLEQLTVVSQVLAKGMGVTRGQLRALGSQFEITSTKIIGSLLSSATELDQNFSKTLATVEQQFTILGNKMLVFVGRLNQTSGATTQLGVLLLALGDNMETVGRLAGAAGLAGAFLLSTKALRALTLAIASNPLGLLAIGLTAGISLLVAFSDQIEISSGSLVTLADVGVASFERITDGFSLLIVNIESNVQAISELFDGVFDGFEVSFEGFVRGTAIGLDTWIGFWRGVINGVIELFKGLGPSLLDLGTQAINGLIGVFEFLLVRVDAILRTIFETLVLLGSAVKTSFVTIGRGLQATLAGETKLAVQILEAGNRTLEAKLKTIAQLGNRFGDNLEDALKENILPRIENTAEGAAAATAEAIKKGFIQGFSDITAFQDAADDVFDRAGELAKERLAELTRNAALLEPSSGAGAAPTPARSGLSDTTLQALEAEINLLRLSNSERKIGAELQKRVIQLKRQGVQVDEEGRAQLEGQIRQIRFLREIASAIDDVTGSQISLTAAQAELNTQVAAGNITLDQAQQAFRNLQDAALESERGVGAGFQRGLNKITDDITNFADVAENTLVNAFNSAEDALVQFVQTGEFSISGLVDSILADLTRLLARQAIASLIGSLGGGGAGAFGSIATSLFGGRQFGGDAQAGRSFMVGEKGRPEIFTPDVNGTITPLVPVGGSNDQGSRGDITFITVRDEPEAEVEAALATSRGQRAVIQVLKKNRNAVKELA